MTPHVGRPRQLFKTAAPVKVVMKRCSAVPCTGEERTNNADNGRQFLMIAQFG